MTFNRPLPPMELFIRNLGWAVASSWTHSSASCRDHQGLRDFALMVSLASLLWCLSHKGWELHFQKQGFLIIIYPLCSVWRQRGRFKVMSVNICFFFHCIIRHLFPSLNFSWLKRYNSSLENRYLILLFIICTSQAPGKTIHGLHSGESAEMRNNSVVVGSFVETSKSINLEG